MSRANLMVIGLSALTFVVARFIEKRFFGGA